MSTNYAQRPYPPYHGSPENYGPWYASSPANVTRRCERRRRTDRIQLAVGGLARATGHY